MSGGTGRSCVSIKRRGTNFRSPMTNDSGCQRVYCSAVHQETTQAQLRTSTSATSAIDSALTAQTMQAQLRTSTSATSTIDSALRAHTSTANISMIKQCDGCMLNRTSPSLWLQVSAWRRLNHCSCTKILSTVPCLIVNYWCKFRPNPPILFLVVI